MSGLLGGGNSHATTKYTGLQIQTSAQGVPIPLVWGTTRMGTNLLWYGDFKAQPDGGKKGGKGGDGKGGGIYNYSTALILGLCEGIGGGLLSIGTVWADRTITSLSALGLTLFTGTAAQAPWSYLASNHPDQALSYAYTAYLANSAYDLGKSPNLPNHTFEISRLASPWSFPAVKDAIMAGVIQDFLTNPQYSVGLSSSQLDISSFGVLYPNYTIAQGLWFSPSLETQEAISSIIDRWAQLSNTWIFWSGNVLKAVPLGDAAIASGVPTTRTINTTVPLTPGPYAVQIVFATSDGGVKYQQTGAALTAVAGVPGPGQYRFDALNFQWIFNASDSGKQVIITGTFVYGGVPYAPDTTIRLDLNYDNLVVKQGTPPIAVTRADAADMPNHVRLEFKNRNNGYNTDIAEWKDDGRINQYGLVDHPITQAHEICDPGVAQVAAQLMGQRGAYIQNTYEFSVNWWMGSVLEPGDLLTLTDPHIGLSLFPVRTRSLEEDEQGDWQVVAEEYPGTTGDAAGTRAVVAPVNTSIHTDVSPGSANPPGVFEPSTALTGGAAQLWVACSGGSDWGGCVVYVSFDGTNYSSIGTITEAAAQGTLTAALADHVDPDAVNTLSISTTISQVALNNDATHSDADAYRTLALITPSFSTVCPAGGECISYGAVSITGTYADNITYLRRALYGTGHSAHSSGDFFTRLDLSKTSAPGNSVLIWDLPVQYIGQTIYLKLCSFNRFGNALQNLSAATAYSYTPMGAGYGGGTGGVPTAPSGLAAAAGIGQIVLSWSSNPLTDNVSSYVVYAAAGLSQPFSSASQIGTTASPSFTATGIGASTSWTFFVKARNAAGLSGPAGGVNATVAATVPNLFRLSGNLAGQPGASQVLFEIEMVGGEAFPISLTGSVGGCDVAPTGSITCALAKNGAAIGSMNIAAGATTATFTFASAVTFASGDLLSFTAPTSADATLSGLHYTFIGTR